MNQLTLEWTESGQSRTQVITDQQPTQQAGRVRIGRDPARCDIVMHHPTVSGLHVEIFFDAGQHRFYLRNLRDSNPPLVNRQPVTTAPIALQTGTQIVLGQLELTVTNITLPLAPTVLANPIPVGLSPAAARRSPIAPPPAPGVSPIHLSYGLQCPKCHRVSSYQHLEAGCPWCGTSLAAAQSALIVPENEA